MSTSSLPDGHPLKGWPTQPLTDDIRERGYDEHAFDTGYWLDNPLPGHPSRIQRCPQLLVTFTKSLITKQAIPKSPVICDIGAGAGVVVAALRAAGFSAVGCEYSASGRALAKQRFNVVLPSCDLRDEPLPFKDHLFDLAFSIGILTLIPRQFLPHALHETRRVIKPTGLLFVLLLNPNVIPGHNPHHISGMPRSEWLALFQQAGFNESPHLPKEFGFVHPHQFSWILQ